MTTPDGDLARTNRALPASAGERASAADLPSQYAPAAVEGPLYERWVARGYFEADAKSEKPPFCIVIPPPNVTGSLHVGHAFEHTLIDTLVRRRRMQGYEALWLPGMDHASIAVHALVERQLEAEGTSRRELGRERFIERTWEWKEQYGGRILDQMRRLGDGVDWSREAFTMDEPRSRAVQTIFKRLYDDGVIYRAERMVNWSPVLRSVLSDAEVDHREVEGELVSMRYGSLDGSGPSVVVATTRVETMLGDTAVAVHPDDPRYAELVGQEIELPLTGRRIPVIADTHVDPDFGTGAVKVTPAHDPNDFAIGQRHGLAMPTIMDEQGRITGTGTEFDGLDRFAARVAVRERLRAEGRIVAERRPYTHSVGHSERSKEPIEPRLSLQWFVGVAPLAKAAGDAVRDGRVRVHPAEAASRYFAWVDHLHDWCISRQLWWGHRIPVWYGPEGEVVCLGPDDEAPTGPGWEQDPDVLDTWFSSALWPFSTLGWPDRTADLEKFYPNQVLVTGYDILFFWVVRMMMMGLYANDGVQPFDVIALHGMIRDENGRKMSKSAGNVVDPIEWMDRYGADAVRFTLANAANPGTDGPVSERGAQSSRNFCNKLWNTTRFALLNGATVERPVPPRDGLAVVDRWILSRLDATVAEVDALYEDFQFAKLTEVLYHFARDEVSDWYLELAKVPLGRGGSEAAATQAVLGHVLDVLLRLLHPVVPFVTDALWTSLTGAESAVIAPWPGLPTESRHDEAAEREVAWLQEVVIDLRTFRTLQKLPPRQWIPTRVTTSDDAMAAWWATHEAAFRSLTRSGPPSDGFVATVSQQHAHTGLGELSVGLDLSGTIDVAAERKRLERDLTAARKELHQTTAKLGNQAFLDRAPEPVVVDVRSRKDEAQAEVNRIEDQLAGLPPADA